MNGIMRVSVCVGEYAKTSYCIPKLEMQVFCMEELCYCLKENAFLLDLSLLDEKLVDWIARECKLKELATALYPLVRKQGSLSSFVGLIFDYVGLYDEDTMRELDSVLKEGAGLGRIEKRKNQIDCLVGRKKYVAAVHQYKELLGFEEEISSKEVTVGILHNMGVALAGMMEYADAADAFWAAYDMGKKQDCYLAYLAAKRMELSEKDYLSLIADQPDSYELSLELERRVEQVKEDFQKQEVFQKLEKMQKWRSGSDKQRYYDEVESIAGVLKSNYRSSVEE